MKTRNFYFPILATFLLISLGCSKDSIDEPIIERQLETQTVSTKKMMTLNFKELGKFELVKPDACSFDGQYNVYGDLEDENYGLFSTKILICTDFDSNFFLKGAQYAPNGDALHFFADHISKDGNGYWVELNYYGGTGEFEFASGQVKVKMTEGFQGNTHGAYIFYGKGTLSM